ADRRDLARSWMNGPNARNEPGSAEIAEAGNVARLRGHDHAARGLVRPDPRGPEVAHDRLVGAMITDDRAARAMIPDLPSVGARQNGDRRACQDERSEKETSHDSILQIERPGRRPLLVGRSRRVCGSS